MIPNITDSKETAIQDEETNVPSTAVTDEVPPNTEVPPTTGTQATQVEHRLQAEKDANCKLREGFVPYPEGLLNLGMEHSVMLPSPEQQKAGFKLTEQEMKILNGQFPQYLPIVPKGGND